MASSIENLQGMIIQPLGKGGDSQWGPLGKGGFPKDLLGMGGNERELAQTNNIHTVCSM